MSGPVLEATDKAIAAAAHLTDADQGAVEALRRVAGLIDAQSETGLTPDGKLDNVNLPTYLRYCEALGLTPAGRAKLEIKKGREVGKLAQLRSVGKAS